jgi:hypothetical protein
VTCLCDTRVSYGKDLFGKKSGTGFDVTLHVTPGAGSPTRTQAQEATVLQTLRISMGLVEVQKERERETERRRESERKRERENDGACGGTQGGKTRRERDTERERERHGE